MQIEQNSIQLAGRGCWILRWGSHHPLYPFCPSKASCQPLVSISKTQGSTQLLQMGRSTCHQVWQCEYNSPKPIWLERTDFWKLSPDLWSIFCHDTLLFPTHKINKLKGNKVEKDSGRCPMLISGLYTHSFSYTRIVGSGWGIKVITEVTRTLMCSLPVTVKTGTRLGTHVYSVSIQWSHCVQQTTGPRPTQIWGQRWAWTSKSWRLPTRSLTPNSRQPSPMYMQQPQRVHLTERQTT